MVQKYFNRISYEFINCGYLTFITLGGEFVEEKYERFIYFTDGSDLVDWLLGRRR